MSKISDAKQKQGYQGKPSTRRCRVCSFLNAEKKDTGWGGWSEILRCGLGGFAVKPNAVCNMFTKKE